MKSDAFPLLAMEKLLGPNATSHPDFPMRWNLRWINKTGCDIVRAADGEWVQWIMLNDSAVSIYHIAIETWDDLLAIVSLCRAMRGRTFNEHWTKVEAECLKCLEEKGNQTRGLNQDDHDERDRLKAKHDNHCRGIYPPRDPKVVEAERIAGKVQSVILGTLAEVQGKSLRLFEEAMKRDREACAKLVRDALGVKDKPN